MKLLPKDLTIRGLDFGLSIQVPLFMCVRIIDFSFPSIIFFFHNFSSIIVNRLEFMLWIGEKCSVFNYIVPLQMGF